jgi:VCBS repeat-containing protein
MGSRLRLVGWFGGVSSGLKNGKRNSRASSIPHRPLRCELLEDRRLLSIESPQLEIFRVLPALFAENQGQWADASVRFVHDGNGANVAMTDSGPVFQVFRPTASHQTDAGAEHGSRPAGLTEVLDRDPYLTEALTFSVQFPGSNAVVPVGLSRSQTYFNYFVGPQECWRAEVPSYEVVAYEGLYDGVDLFSWGQRDSLKYEFHVAPGSDYRQIEVRYEGIGALSLGEDGSLVVDLGEGWGTLIDDRPYIYQEIDGQKVQVAGRFRLLDAVTYSFEVTGSYDPARQLVIDPELAWSTYLGGNSYDYGYAIAVDGADGVYVSGETDSVGWTSSGFDTSYNGGAYDGFLIKLASSGQHIWSTYLGGGSWDGAVGIAVDDAGGVYVTGETESAGWTSGGFDTSQNGNRDAYVAKLTADGQHVWSTYLGGESWDEPFRIAVGGDEGVYVAGWTGSGGWTSGGFDTSYNGGTYDAFVAKLTPQGQHAWSTYLGGDQLDRARDIAIDSAGGVYVSGETHSAGWTSGGFDTGYDGNIDAFVAKLTAEGQHAWSTYLGGGAWDESFAIAVDDSGWVYVAGNTSSPGWTSGGFDTGYNGNNDAFMVKLSAAGQHAWSTYLGGNAGDYVWAVDVAGGLYVTGWTHSVGWTSGGFDTTFNGAYDGFVVKIQDNRAPVAYDDRYTTGEDTPLVVGAPGQASDLWLPLVTGVGRVAPLNVPGPLEDLTGQWTPIVGGDEDTTVPSTSVLGRTFGQGRVLAYGKEGLTHWVDVLDNGVFAANAIRWLDVKGTRRVLYTTGHSEWVTGSLLAGLAQRMSGEGYSFEALPGVITSAGLAGASVLVVGNAWAPFTPEEVEAARQFVVGGGGLALVGLGWSWAQYHPGMTMDDYPMTRMAAPYGVGWLTSYISDPTDWIIDSSGYVTPVFHTFYPDLPWQGASAGVLANDADEDQDPISAVLVSGPTHGQLTPNADGTFTYTPAANFNGEDTFTYRAYDGQVYSNVATVTITVGPVNDLPLAADDACQVPEDGVLTVPTPGVLGNDADPDGDLLSAVLVTGPAHGQLTLNPSGSFTYTPAGNYHGPDSFTYKANDGQADSNVATVTITVTPVNDRPVALDDAYQVAEDGVLTVPTPGVLGNDTDPDGDLLSAVLVTGPAHGQLTLNPSGTFTYTPAGNYHGLDNFTYKANDGQADSNVATVTITVAPVNDPPVAGGESYRVGQKGRLAVAAPGLLGNDTDIDGDTLTAILVAKPGHGTLELNADGSFTYTPVPSYNGSDSFTYKANDGQADSNVATVTITVRAPQFTTGVFTAGNLGFHLAGENLPGASQNSFAFNVRLPSWLPLAGDWDGDGDDTVGVFDPSTTSFYLINNNSSANPAPIANFPFSFNANLNGWTPLAGDWDGNGDDTVGVWDPASCTFYLINNNSSSNPQAVPSFSFRANLRGWIPIAGDWDGDGDDTVGVFNPADGMLYLINNNSAGNPQLITPFSLGVVPPSAWPVAGDWNGDGVDTVGIYSRSENRFYLANANQAWPPGGITEFVCSVPVSGAVPLAGDWNGPSQPLAAAGLPARPSSAAALTEAQLGAIADEAIRRWLASGITAAQASQLAGVKLSIADLPGLELGRAEGALATLDVDAAGHGWFVDPTPGDDEEFVPASAGLRAVDPLAVDRMDLLTAVAHEFGHILGLEDVAAGSVMAGKLQPGQRQGVVDAALGDWAA